MQKSHVFIEQCHVTCRIGTTESERALPQNVILDIWLFFDLTEAAASDNVAHTIDYSDIYTRIKHVTDTQTFHLVESLAHTICELILGYDAVEDVHVKVTKKVWAGVSGVGCFMTRTKHRMPHDR